jgi:nucleotide-binding universal stress UspA family protein
MLLTWTLGACSMDRRAVSCTGSWAAIRIAAQSSLIVIGPRGVSGGKALGSVSERVVHGAACSVLVVPSPHGA